MDTFPFTGEEWERVTETASLITKVILADDRKREALYFSLLQHQLEVLRMKYGDHPALIETEADYTPDPTAQTVLYSRAIQLASKNSIQTHTILLSRAEVLLRRLQNPRAAFCDLEACRADIESAGEGYEQAKFRELVLECQAAEEDRLERDS